MIDDNTIKRMSAERQLALDLIEKDYVLGWILKGISTSTICNNLIFKGGTALSKAYYPLNWRMSEDLDFTLVGGSEMEKISSRLKEELPKTVEDLSGGIKLIFKEPYIKTNFLRVTVSFIGPITQHKTKIEVTKEEFIGDYYNRKINKSYDCPEFSLQTYTLDTILAEKLRSLIERTKIRDYYDAWRLLGMNVVDAILVKRLFLKKCEGKGIVFEGVNQFFPENLAGTLQPYLHTLTRLTSEPLPPLIKMLEELRMDIETLSL